MNRARKTPVGGGAAAAMLFAVACAGPTVEVAVRLDAAPCSANPALDPLQNVSELRLTVYGPGLTPAPVRVKRADRHARMPLVAAGVDRVLVVEGLAVPGDVVISRGESPPLDLDRPGQDKVEVRVTLRRADAFTPAAGPSATGCVALGRPRAGHSATLLPDGRVLVAGGFVENAAGARVFERSTEIFDPRDGTLVRGPDLVEARALHSASLHPESGQTILAGGEGAAADGVATALASAELLPPGGTAFERRPLRSARVHHAASAALLDGAVILAGGRDGAGAPLASTEYFDPRSRTFQPGPALARRRVAPAAATADGMFVVLGGHDGAEPAASAELFALRKGVPQAQGEIALAEARHGAVAGLLGAGVALLGGFSALEADSPFSATSAVTQFVDLQSRTAARTGATLGTRRAEASAVSLPDGSVLVLGGATADGGGEVTDLDSAELLALVDGEPAARTVGAMRVPRRLAAAVLLPDGSVLVSGGFARGPHGARTFSASLEIFQPRYATSPAGRYR